MKKIKKNEYRVAKYLKKYIPESWMKQWDEFLEKSFRDQTVSAKENHRRLEEFQLKQISIVFWSVVSCLLLLVILWIFSLFAPSLIFSRNSFGQGEKEIYLQVEDDGKKEEVTLVLEEQSLTQEEEEKIFQQFFRDLEKAVRGENESLWHVDQSLNFLEELEDYPFQITYQPSDPNLIQWDGSLGEDAFRIRPEEKIQTRIKVEASYKDYQKEGKIYITMFTPRKEKLTLIERFRKALVEREILSRNEEEFTLENTWETIKISEASNQGFWMLPFMLLGIMILLLLRGHSQLQEREKIRHKENMEDFPVIVHLMTLYMGAGLSFSTCVDRISRDYEERKEMEKEGYERYAFEQIRVMNQIMHMGVRPKEACLSWGDHFPEKIYARFAMILSQGFSKGAREIRVLMEKEQQDAFQVQVDYVRKQGEIASTKLLFPMMLLLVFVMILVMFPAMLQFYTMG